MKKNKKTHAITRRHTSVGDVLYTRTHTHTRTQGDKQETSGISMIYLRIVLYRIHIGETYRVTITHEQSDEFRRYIARSLRIRAIAVTLEIHCSPIPSSRHRHDVERYFYEIELQVMRRFVVLSAFNKIERVGLHAIFVNLSLSRYWTVKNSELNCGDI